MKKQLIALAATLTFAPVAAAQHTVNIGANWVLNSTISTVPQNNTDSQITPGASAYCNAQADSAKCSIVALAQSIAGVGASATTSASGSRQSSYSVTSVFNGLITCSGTAEATGAASLNGLVNGNFLCKASYSNSIGVDCTRRVRFQAGTLLLQPPKSFAVSMLGINYSFSSSSSANVFCGTFGQGSSLTFNGSAKVESTTNRQ